MNKKAVRYIVKIIINIIYKPRYKGIENIPDDEAVLLCANHVSLLDGVLISCGIKPWINWMAKKEIFNSRFNNYFFSNLGVFPVDRGKVDLSAIKKALKLLKNNENVGIFPQGTRKIKNVDNDIKNGAAMLALHANVKILPVFISEQLNFFKRVDIVFGKPYKIEGVTKHNSDKTKLNVLSINIMNKIYSLSEESIGD